MKKTLSLFLGALALTFCMSGGAMAEDADKGIKMGNFVCEGSTFQCNDLASISSKLPEVANACLRQQMGVKEDVFSSFGGAGENCMRSADYTENAGFKSWTICCVKKSDDDSCYMLCTPYILSKSK